MSGDRNNNVISSLGAIIGIIGQFIAIVITIEEYISKSQSSWKIVFVYTVTSMFTVMCIFAIRSLIYNNNNEFANWIKFNLQKDKGSYYLKSKTLTYEYTDRTHINHEREFVVYPLKNDVASIRDRYIYSGKTKCELNPTIAGQNITNVVEDELGAIRYSITTPESCVKRTPITFGMRMNTLYDPEKKAKTFLSTVIYEPTELLVMKVKFGISVEPINAQIKEYECYTNDRTAIYLGDLKFNSEERELKYELKYPVLGHQYVIRWNFRNEVPAT